MLHGSSGGSRSKRSSQFIGFLLPTFNSLSEDEVAFFVHIQHLLNSVGEYNLTVFFDLTGLLTSSFGD